MSDIPSTNTNLSNRARKFTSTSLLPACLVVAGVALISCATHPSSSQSPGTLDSPHANQTARPTTVPGLLQEATRLRAQGKLREAEVLLTRAQQTEGDNLTVWQALLSFQLQITDDQIQALPGDSQARGKALLDAGKELERARSSLNGIRGLSVAPGSRVEPAAVVQAEVVFAKSEDRFKEEAQSYSKSRIEDAHFWRNKAAHWYKKNNRNEVVNGLVEVRRVQALTPWLGEDVRGSAATVMSQLKALVNEEEWPDLLARAGFDPNSPAPIK